ncbi:MAG: AAA family ATPase, partial [Chloroflexi bacterium]|nr:AAA family ATPase [Chloroflexota bacterium]
MQEPSGPTAQKRRAEGVPQEAASTEAPQSPCVTAGAAPCRLLELTIRSLAIIDALRIEWTDGLNLLSGETGAGKSIIIDALGAALGDRVDLTLVRSGADRASVEAVFSVASDAHRVRAILDEVGCTLDDDVLVLTREMAQGRSISRINGRTVTASVVQQLAERL